MHRLLTLPYLNRGEGAKIPTSSPRVVYLLCPILTRGGKSYPYLFTTCRLLTLLYLNREGGKIYPPPHTRCLLTFPYINWGARPGHEGSSLGKLFHPRTVNTPNLAFFENGLILL